MYSRREPGPVPRLLLRGRLPASLNPPWPWEILSLIHCCSCEKSEPRPVVTDFKREHRQRKAHSSGRNTFPRLRAHLARRKHYCAMFGPTKYRRHRLEYPNYPRYPAFYSAGDTAVAERCRLYCCSIAEDPLLRRVLYSQTVTRYDLGLDTRVDMQGCVVPDDVT